MSGLLAVTGGAPRDEQPPADEIGALSARPPYVARGSFTAVIVPYVQVFTTGLLVPIDVRFRGTGDPPGR